MSHISMIRAMYVCPGMVFATDGFKVESNIYDEEENKFEIHARKGNYVKVAKVEPTKDLPIWVED